MRHTLRGLATAGSIIALLMGGPSWAQDVSPGSPSGATGAAGGDLGGTYPNPTVLSLADVTTGILGAANGGTGATSLAGAKIVTAPVTPTTGNCPVWTGSTAIGDSGAPCGSSVFAVPKSGYWYLPYGITLAGGTALTANKIACQAFVTFAPMTVKTLGVWISTLGTGNIQLAVYSNANGQPGTLLGATGNIADTSTGNVNGTPTGGNFTLSGTYWDCVNATDSTVVLSTVSSAGGRTGSIVGASTQALLQDSATTTRKILTLTQTEGTWPSDLSGSTFTEADSLSSGVIQKQAN